MVRDGQLLCSRNGAFGLIDKMNLIKGRVQGRPDGYGFLIPEEGGDDIFLSPQQMKCAFDGDRALVRVTGKNFRGKDEGRIIEVLQSNTQTLVGRYYNQDGIGVVAPESKRITQDILIPPGNSIHAQDGDVVHVEILEQPQFRKAPIGKITEVIGEHMAPGMEIDIALRSYDIPHVWPDEVTDQAQCLPNQVQKSDLKGRVDLRNKALVTIDGEDARDFDDAVYAEAKKAGGWRLYVAIADVSHYVQPNAPLDIEARSRGTSVYFPEQVVPMLPEALSNGLCSLNPNVDRLAMVCEIEIDDKGKAESYRFYEAVIHSHARLTYNQVAAMLLEPESDLGLEAMTDFDHVLPHLYTLYNLYQALRKTRKSRGAIDFETTETRIIFDEHRKIEQIVPTERNDAHKLIEECMLLANVCTAKMMEELEIPALYRVHDSPSFEKLENLRSYLGELGLELGGGLKPTTKDYQRVMKQIEKRDDFNLIQTVLLRSMTQAVYQPQNIGHFGLAFDAYAHFTSPIRRYPDLLIHRAIRAVIHSGKRTSLVRRTRETQKLPFEQNYPYDLPAMLALGEHCSMCERRADEATWDVIAWLKCEYMQEHLGEEFEGTVSSVVPFGLFVQLNEIFVEGLVHVTSLNSDYYHYDEVAHRLIGERTRVMFSMGAEVRIKVAKVNLDERKIDFELLESRGLPKAPRNYKPDTKKSTKAKKPTTGKKPKPKSKKSVSRKTNKANKKTSGKSKRKAKG